METYIIPKYRLAVCSCGRKYRTSRAKLSQIKCYSCGRIVYFK